MAVYTDIAAELYPESRGSVPRGVKTFTATASGIGLTRVEIERSGLRRPKGRYITLDMPQFAAIDDRNEAYVWAIASQLRALLPKEGLVLVAGVGNRAVTADALGPETADRVFVTRHLCEHPDAGDGPDCPQKGVVPVFYRRQHPLLPFDADLVEQDVAGIAQELVIGHGKAGLQRPIKQR